MEVSKVLAIDDDADLLRLVALTLKALAGWQVTQARSIAQGLELARASAPDVILLDIMMPGDDGFAALVRLRDMGSLADVPVIVMTARPREDELVRACLRQGARAVIHKPFEPLTLHERIRAAIAQPRTAVLAGATEGHSR